jgi:hypothetical protein
VIVDNLPADIEKQYDRQLEMVTQHLLAMLQKTPIPPLTFPASPDKSIPGFLEQWKQWTQEAQPAPIRLPKEN